jgi:nitroimidazol reductase NimA-like FMN-containing flavoprotein (pyridoxamine 5'-phosphate oxidase superfamily)
MTTPPSPPRKSREELKAIATDFLKNHRLGIVATGKRDGSPQMSIVSYVVKGSDIVVSTGSATAKYKNARRNPRVSLAVYDGPTCVVVYGEARLLQGAEAETYLGEAPSSGRQPGTPTLIVFPATTYRWARIEG